VKIFRNAPLPILLVILVAIVLGMLYFGVRFKGYRPANGVELLPALKGVYFQKFAIAYTEDFFIAPDDAAADRGLTIEMALRIEKQTRPTFNFILSVHDGNDERQLVVGQWRESLVVMNGDDYDGKKGVRKLYVDIGPVLGKTVWLSIRSGADGTYVYIDGLLVKSNARLHLDYPNRTGNARLVIGNSVYGRHGWQGMIAGLALYEHGLSETAVQAHEARWKATGASDWLVASSAPTILYRLDRPVHRHTINQAGSAYHLQIPPFMKILKKEFLQWPRISDGPRWALVQDGVLNLIGFIPLGFVLSAVLLRLEGAFRKYYWQVAVGLAFAFSLSLEVTQAWIPSRDSSSLDLILNTMGAGLGTLLTTVTERGYK
jgi:hypothetical protein